MKQEALILMQSNTGYTDRARLQATKKARPVLSWAGLGL
jgi:hypothetical protein